MRDERREEKTEFMRRELDEIQKTKLDILEWAGIPRKKVLKAFSFIRDCMTIAKKHYPKPEDIFEEYQKSRIREAIAQLESAQTLGREIPDGEVLKILDFLNFPKRFKENYSDTHFSVLKPYEKFRDYYMERMKEGHYDDLFPVEIDEARVERMHEKYKKEFAKLSSDYKDWIDDYLKRND